jgi:hypothetical protein
MEDMHNNVPEIHQNPSPRGSTLLPNPLSTSLQQPFLHFISNRLDHTFVSAATDQEGIGQGNVLGHVKCYQVGPEFVTRGGSGKNRTVRRYLARGHEVLCRVIYTSASVRSATTNNTTAPTPKTAAPVAVKIAAVPQRTLRTKRMSVSSPWPETAFAARIGWDMAANSPVT